MRKITKIVFILLILVTSTYPEILNSHTISTGIGFGFHEGERTIGCGRFFSLGYKHPTRFKILNTEAGLTRGEFSQLCVTDIRPQQFTSTNLTIGLAVDIFQLWIFSLSTSCGFSIDYTEGTLAPGGEIWVQGYEHIEKWSPGIYINAGVGINFFKNKFRISFNPLNYYTGPELKKEYPMIKFSVRI